MSKKSKAGRVVVTLLASFLVSSVTVAAAVAPAGAGAVARLA